MFTFEPILPCPALQPYIARYVITGIHFSTIYRQTIIPINNQNIGFILKGSIKSTPFCSADSMLAKSYVMGQITEAVDATYYNDLEGFIIFFKPSGMYRLFGIPMYEFTDRGFDFELVAGKEGKELVEKIFDSNDREYQLACIEKFLLRQLDKHSLLLTERMAYASNMMAQQYGAISITKLADMVNMCERGFERHFLEKVGVSPKSFCRIARMKKAMQMIESSPQPSWCDITYTLNYTDQAHFIHDFKKLTGKTPTEYYKFMTAFDHFFNK